MKSQRKCNYPVSKARFKAVVKEHGTNLRELSRKTGRSEVYFNNLLQRDNFTELDITFLEAQGISYDDIKPLAEREREQIQKICMTYTCCYLKCS